MMLQGMANLFMGAWQVDRRRVHLEGAIDSAPIQQNVLHDHVVDEVGLPQRSIFLRLRSQTPTQCQDRFVRESVYFRFATYKSSHGTATVIFP